MKSTAILLLLSLFLLDLSAQCPNYHRPGIHVVQTGENLYRIAKQYNVSTGDLAQWNNISTSTTLYACQELSVTNHKTYQNHNSTNEFITRGNSYNSSYSSNDSGSSFVKQAGNKHTIREGETIKGLANLYGYTEDRFRKINVLRPGEELSVGSRILSTDCNCDRVVSYDDLNANNSFANSSNNSTYREPSTYTSNSPQNRNFGETSAFITSAEDKSMDNVSISYETSTGRAAQSMPATANNVMITSAPAQSTANGGATEASNTKIVGNSNGTPAPANATYMGVDELTMLDEINLLRSNPAGYIQYVEQYRRELQRVEINSSAGPPYPTIDELIAELRRTPALPLLEPTPCLYEVAKKHGIYQQSIKTLTHDGPGFIQPFERIIAGCKEMGMILGNENLISGVPSIRGSVIELLVDHGVSKRGHRKNLLNPRWKYGVTYKVGYIGQSPHSWVQKFGFN